MLKKMMNFAKTSHIFTLFILLFSITVNAQTNVIDFESEQWVLTNAKVVEHLGRKALIGMAYLKDVQFENGVIEVDVARYVKRIGMEIS